MHLIRYFVAMMVVMIISFHEVISVEKEIAGIVTNGQHTLPWARVRIQTTSLFTTTDYYGKFTLKGITSTDTLVVTAWAEGYYNGQTHAVAGDTDIVILLNKLPAEDNPNYQWISSEPDSTDELNCGNCHTTVVMNQWRNDAHSQSAVNPFFLAMYYGTDIYGNPNVGVGYKRDFPYTRGNCATCHIPGAAANNPWNTDPNEVTGVNRQGVFCDFCHKMYRTLPSDGQGTTGVLSIQLLRPPEGYQIFFGPYDDIHEPDSYLPLIRKSEFCAPCHTGKFWGIPAYDCFPEWRASPYPAMGIECQTCHMPSDSVTTHFAFPEKGGLERDPLTIPSHYMPGSRDLNILANSVTMQVTAEQLRDSIKVMVTIYNDKTGHHVPTGRPSRNMLLLVTATDASADTLDFLKGEKIPSWGGKGDRMIGDYAGYPGRGFAKILEDFEGHSPAPSWRPTHILSDNRIAAFATDTSWYFFRAPATNQLVRINARLIFRRFFKPWMNEKKFDIPDIEMENETVTLAITDVALMAASFGTSEKYWLEQNYPNPFNETTTIRFGVNQPEHVVIKLFNIAGNEVLSCIDSYFPAGTHQFTISSANLSSGLYFYKMQVGSWDAIKKIVIFK